MAINCWTPFILVSRNYIYRYIGELIFSMAPKLVNLKHNSSLRDAMERYLALIIDRFLLVLERRTFYKNIGDCVWVRPFINGAAVQHGDNG